MEAEDAKYTLVGDRPTSPLDRSEQINELAAALAKAQGEMKPAIKNARNPFFKSTYASLDSVMDSLRGPLSKNGLAICQLASDTHLTTILMHSSGQWISSSLLLHPKDKTPQAMGSELTYMRRYGVGAITGQATEEDDDAEQAMSRGQQQARPVQSAPAKDYGHGPVKTVPAGVDTTKHTKMQEARIGAVRALKTTTDAQEMAKSIAQWRTNAKLTDDEYNELMAEMEKVTEDKDVPF